MAEVQANPDLTSWTPTPTELPTAWMMLADTLMQEMRGMPRTPQAYALDIKYNAQDVGGLLRSWGLPWQVVIAGYLLQYEEKDIYSANLKGTSQVLAHMREAIHYIHCIEEDDLFTLLNPPYSDLGALLIAVAVHYAALQALLRRSSGLPYTPREQSQIESAGRTLLNITKRLGMWYFKREIEDLTEQLCNPSKFADERDEHARILFQDKAKLEDIRQLLIVHYQKTTEQAISVAYTACGVAGLKRRRQDAHTTATSQKTQLTGFDLVTFDITIPTVRDCYTTLGVLSQLGYIQDRVTDQIATPKPNGYSHIALGLILKSQDTSLQTLGWVKDGACICQIQIATHLMQAIMRYGCLYPDCYHLYEGVSPQEKLEPPTPAQFWNSQEGKLFLAIRESCVNPLLDAHSPITVYDKSRKPTALPRGATALDFAYAVDVTTGERAVEAFINNRKAPLFRILDAGDIVEIRTSKDIQAQYYWLDEMYTITPSARRHIKESLKRRFRERQGYDLIHKVLGRYHYRLTSEELDEELRLLIEQQKLGTLSSYLERLDTAGEPPYTPEWTAQKIMQQIVERNDLLTAEEHSWIPMQLVTDQNPFRPRRLCSICQPTYPHDMKIVGLLRQRSGDLVVHSVSCPRLVAHTSSQQSILLPMTWQYLPPAFKVAFFVAAQDRRGLILDIAKQLRRHQCVLLSIHAEAILKFKQAELRIAIETQDDTEALSIWQELERIEQVKTVEIDATATPTHIHERLQKQRGQHSFLPAKTVIERIWEETLATLPPRNVVLKNPYDISRPASANMFFGRSSEIKTIRRELCDAENGKTLVLYGPRRSGKSSLCKNFVERYVHPPFWHVLCSLQGATRQTEETILLQVAEEICREFYEQLHQSVPTWWDYDERDAQVRFRRVVQGCLAQVPGSRLILTLDEFGGVLESYEQHILEQRFFTYWRDLVSETPQLSLLLALPTSSHTLLTSEDLSSAFSFAASLPVEFLDKESAERLLVEPLREQNIAVHPSTVALATNLTGGNPYYMVLIGLQLIIQLNQEPRKQIVTDEDLNRAIDRIIDAGSTQNFVFYRKELQGKDEPHILEAIIDITSRTNQPTVSLKKIATALNVPSSIIRPHLERLREGLILEEYDHFSSHPYYSFKIELIRLWMVRNRWFFTL